MKIPFCKHNGRDGGCPTNTAASRVLLKRAQGVTVDLCENCKDALSARYDALSPEEKRRATHPFFSSIEKVAAMEPILIALSRGEIVGLTVREGKCSCADCKNPLGKMAFHHQSIVYPLCGSDSAAAQIAAVRYQRLSQSPVSLEVAKRNARKWSEHDALRRRKDNDQKVLDQSKTNRVAMLDDLLFDAPPTNTTAQTVTLAAPKLKTAADLPISGHLLDVKTGRTGREPVLTGPGNGLSRFSRTGKDDAKESAPVTSNN